MARTLLYHPLFNSDVIEGADWNDAKRPSLGSDFVLRVRQAVDQLIVEPELRSTADYGVRYWPLKRFPYVVFYDLTAKELLVLGVMHTSQDAGKLLSRRR